MHLVLLNSEENFGARQRSGTMHAWEPSDRAVRKMISAFATDITGLANGKDLDG